MDFRKGARDMHGAESHLCSGSGPCIILQSLQHGGVAVGEGPVLNLDEHKLHRLQGVDVGGAPVEGVSSVVAVP